jgi:hypothetical protein
MGMTPIDRFALWAASERRPRLGLNILLGIAFVAAMVGFSIWLVGTPDGRVFHAWMVR